MFCMCNFKDDQKTKIQTIGQKASNKISMMMMRIPTFCLNFDRFLFFQLMHFLFVFLHFQLNFNFEYISNLINETKLGIPITHLINPKQKSTRLFVKHANFANF